MVYSLIITICALSAPDKCQLYEQTVTELSPSPSMAFVEAQAILAQWMEQHPGFKLQRWRLKPGQGA